MRASLAQQEQQGIRLEYLDRAQASELLPIASFDDAALIGYEPDAGFADPYMVAVAFAKGARRAGVQVREGVQVHGLMMNGSRVAGVATSVGEFSCATVVSTQNIWTADLA